MSIQEARKIFIKNLKELGRSSATIIAYDKDIEQLAEFMEKIGKIEPKEVFLEDLQAFMQNFLDKGLTEKTVSRKTNSTKTFFGFLKEKGITNGDPSEFLKHPKVKTTAPRILSQMEYRALRDVTRNDPRTYVLLEVFLQTGLSISEVSGMKLEHLHLDIENPYIYVPARDSKEERNVPLNPAITALLKDYLAKERFSTKEGHVFVTRTGNPLLVRNIRATMNRYFVRAGIENATVNDLRHTFIAHNLMNGVSISFISKVVGHKRVSTTERYLEHIKINEVGQKAELVVL